jgi:nucleotide-binding universal stress UspA family protein
MSSQSITTEIPDGAVLVGVDGSDHALAAVRWAAEEAASRRERLAIAHATRYAAPENLPAQIGHARAVLSQAYATALPRTSDIRPTMVLLDEDPVPALAGASERAALLVLGMTGSGGLGDILLGSTTVEVCGQARCPAVGVRRWPHTHHTDPIVVLGLSALPTDAPAVQVAFELASRRGWELTVVHTRHGRRRDRNPLADRLAGWSRRYPDVTVSWRLPTGPPDKALLELAGSAEAVVTGSRRHGHVARALLGSTSRSVLRHSPAPVIVAGPDILTSTPSDRWYATDTSADPHAHPW